MKKLSYLLAAAAIMLVGCKTDGVDSVGVNGVNLTEDVVDIEVGDNVQLHATTEPSNADNNGVSWSSSNPAVATVDPATGIVTGVALGETEVTVATDEGNFTASCIVNVGIKITELTLGETLTVHAGETFDLNELVLITPEDATFTELTWSSNKTDVADVDAAGILTAKKESATVEADKPVITATAVIGFAGNVKATAKLTVTVTAALIPVEGIAIEETLTLEAGLTGTLDVTFTPENASNKNVTWSSDDEAIATVDPETGLITAVAAGTANITATSLDGEFPATCAVTVVAPVESVAIVDSLAAPVDSLTLQAGETAEIEVALTPEDAYNKEVSWRSEDGAIATVIVDAETGIATVTAVAVGETEVVVESASVGNPSASVVVTVIPTPLEGIMIPETFELKMGQSIDMEAVFTPENATNKELIWSSDNEAVATVDSLTGKITTVAPGTANITAKSVEGGFTDTCALTVVPVALTGISIPGTSTIEVGQKQTLEVTFNPANATNKGIVWSNMNNAIATVDPVTGEITAIAVGQTAVQAKSVDGGYDAICVVTVVAAPAPAPAAE